MENARDKSRDSTRKVVKMKIEIGAGETPKKPTYHSTDIRCLPNIDYCCHALELDKHIKPITLTHVYARHFLEHLTFNESEQLLIMLYNLLAKGGEVEILVPNMTFHIDQWVNKRKDLKQMKHAKAGFWGWQRGENENYWDVHKSGYDEETMEQFVIPLGYVNFVSLANKMDKHLHVKFYKGEK